MASVQLTTLEQAAVVPLRPDLTTEQRQQVLAAAGALIRAAVTGEPAEWPDPTLAGAAEQRVAGAFVSLKRGGHLRSCTGGLLDHAVALGKALEDAAVRTALEDTRFPPVSPTELEHLDMEVWVLYNPRPVEARGEERVRAVITGGKHGLVVSRGQARGLLLPGVAVEHNWDSRRFLEQVCVKAGMHPSLWKDDATALLTFEGEALRGRVGDMSFAPCRPFFDRGDLPAYTSFVRGNISAQLAGATPNYYLFGAPDGHVSGVALAIRFPGTGQELTFAQFSLRPGVPLQSTLFALAQAAAQALAGHSLAPEALEALEVSLAILHDTALHGTVADSHLVGLDAARRAVLVMERSRAGLVLDAQATAEQLVREAASHAQVRRPAGAGVFSLEAAASGDRLAFSSGPRPVAGPTVRTPGVAGRFYPRDPVELASLVNELLEGGAERRPWPAAMVPHAGLRFSGRIAADVLKRIAIPRTVIVLGPKHTGLGMDWAVAPHHTWALPGGQVASDPELASRLAESIPGLTLDALAHQQEHAIEVELPFLARLAPGSRVVGIAIGSGDLDDCRRFAEGLAAVLRQREDPPLLLISSDMNHFATDQETRRLDGMAVSALERLDPAEVYETVTENGISMCGVLPAVIVLETLRLLGKQGRAERVGYATSADVTGDPTRVVGYAGMLFGG